MYSANIVGKQMDSVFGLYLPNYDVPPPEVQTNYVEVVGRDGAIDKTAPDGVVRYKDREWALEFQKTGPDVSADDLPSISRALYNELHGRQGEIIFDDDASYKWIGRVFVDNVSCENNGLIIASIRLITKPYRYKLNGISKGVVLSSRAVDVTLTNGRKPLVPTVIVTGSAALEFTIRGEEYSIELSAGTWTVSDLILFEGDTVVSVSGSGIIRFEYPEASL